MQVEKLLTCVIYVGVLSAVVCVFLGEKISMEKHVSVDHFIFLKELCCHLLA